MCNIEGCDVTAAVIIFPIKAENKVLISESQTFHSSSSKVATTLPH